MKPGVGLGIAVWLIFFAISVYIRLSGKRRDSGDGGGGDGGGWFGDDGGHGGESGHGGGDGGGDGGHY
jgi:hypothetical protein